MAELVEEFDMTDTTCKVTACDKPVKRTGFCYGHYMKNWRHGTPTPQFEPKWEDLRGQRFGTLTVTKRAADKWLCQCDCGKQRTVSAGDLNRYGHSSSCGDARTHRRRDDAGYTAAHQRVRQDRGRVQEHKCVDCGHQAQHWSYNHDDPNEMVATGLSANDVAYSLDPNHYSPRCVSCHKVFDLGRTDSARVL